MYMIKVLTVTIKYGEYYELAVRSRALIHKYFTKSLLAINI